MKFLKGLFGKADPTGKEPESELIYIFLPEPLEPVERGSKYEDILDAELQAGGLGWVSGGGTLQSAPQPDGTRLIESCGIDIDTYELDEARAFLRKRLPELGCPRGTRLQFREQEDQPRQDEFDGETWMLDVARTNMHPGLGV